MYEAIVSIDLGRQHDFTAIVLAEEAVWIGARPELDPWVTGGPQVQAAFNWEGVPSHGWVAPSSLHPSQREFFRIRNYSGHRPSRPPMLVRHVERIRGRPYPQIVSEVATLLARPPLAELSTVTLVDAGGVGVAVSDLLWQEGVPHVSITATGGASVNVSDQGRAIHTPKRELVSAAQIMLAQGRFRIAAGLAHAATLTKELQDYRVTLSVTGHDSYDARSGEHDDLVFSAAMLCWYRDWYSQPTDDAIAKAQRPATVRS